MDQEEMARTGAHFHRESLLKSRFQTGSALDTAQKSHVTRMEKHFCLFSVLVCPGQRKACLIPIFSAKTNISRGPRR